MHKGFDELFAHDRSILQFDPFNGAVFPFRGKTGDRLKGLVWDRSGFSYRDGAGDGRGVKTGARCAETRD